MYKMSNYEKQKATAYIAYMIIGSYFGKTIFPNHIQEKRLLLDYREMPVKQQYQTEEIVDNMMSHLPESVLAQIKELRCQLVMKEIDTDYELRFETFGFGSIIARINETGRVSIICK